jgi:hypothetical protein
MSLRDLGLPYRLEQMMDRPFISRSGIFVEVNGKYFLSEERLKALKDHVGIPATGQARARRPSKNMKNRDILVLQRTRCVLAHRAIQSFMIARAQMIIRADGSRSGKRILFDR